MRAIGGLNTGERDPLVKPPEGKNKPRAALYDHDGRAWLAAVADWFMRSGLTEEQAARQTVREAGRRGVGWKQVREWRRSYMGAADPDNSGAAAAAARFRRLTDRELPKNQGFASDNAFAVWLARAAPR
jgi:hypothetical protein